MRTLSHVRCLALLALTLGVATIGWAAEPVAPKVDVRVVKYADLGKTIRQYAGKVVVVDFWADTCIPCKKRFPHMVEMAQKYTEQGLVVITVSVDPDPQKKEVQDTALKFLTRNKATFTNLMLDEPAAFWSDKLGIAELPCVYLFNRDGKWRKLTSEVTSEEVEKLAVESLKEK